MCGIYGWSLPDAAGVTPEQKAVLAALLGSQNDNRGGDSFGIYYVNGEQKILRGLGKCIDGIAWPTLSTARVLLGHTRKATTGATTVANAHPYEIDNLIGAHNGMISNHEEMNRKHERTFEVDSMHIFKHISEGKPLSELTGYGAIEYVNKRINPERVALVRFSGGELSVFGIGEDTDKCVGAIWSSSETHLVTALLASGLKDRVFKFKVEEGQQYYVLDGYFHYGQKARMDLSASYTSSWRSDEYYDGKNWRKYGDYGNSVAKDKDKDKQKDQGKPVRRKLLVDSYAIIYEGPVASYYDTGKLSDLLSPHELELELRADATVELEKEEPKPDDPKAASDAILEQITTMMGEA